MNLPLKFLADIGSGTASLFAAMSLTHDFTSLRMPAKAFSGFFSSQLKLGNSAHSPTRNGPRKLDSAVREIFPGFQAANSWVAWPKYTESGVRRFGGNGGEVDRIGQSRLPGFRQRSHPQYLARCDFHTRLSDQVNSAPQRDSQLGQLRHPSASRHPSGTAQGAARRQRDTARGCYTAGAWGWYRVGDRRRNSPGVAAWSGQILICPGSKPPAPLTRGSG